MKNYKILSVLVIIIMFFGSNVFSQNELFGTYYYRANATIPLSNVNVDLFNLNDSLIASTVTNTDGEYVIQGIPDGLYYMSSSTQLTAGGVDLYDAFLVLWYINGWVQFNDMEFEIADVNASETVNYTDFFLIFINYLIQGQPFPAGDWEFQDVEIDFTVRENSDTVDVWGSSYGDVEGEWDPIGRDIDLMASSYYNYELTKIGETASFAVATDYNGYVNGFNLSFSYPIDEINILKLNGPDGNFTYAIDDETGVIRVAWLNESQGISLTGGDELFTIDAEFKTDIETSGEKVLYLLPGGMIIDSENNKLNDTEIKLPLVLNKQQTTDFVEVQAYPNPVVNKLNFNIQLNKQSYASLSVYDLSGKLVNFIENIALHEGEQVVSYNAEDLLPGNYIYSFELKGENDTNVMGRFVKSK